MLIQNCSSEILLLQRSPRLAHPYLWGLTGGIIEDETALRAGIRELWEETGIVESDLILVGIKRFLVETPSEDLKITNIHAKTSQRWLSVTLSPDEHVAYMWQ